MTEARFFSTLNFVPRSAAKSLNMLTPFFMNRELQTGHEHDHRTVRPLPSTPGKAEKSVAIVLQLTTKEQKS
jgi:hypothetical protein